jgi:hypothetical protein
MSDDAAAARPAPEPPAPPTFKPDPELVGHVEGHPVEERLYRRAAEAMRREAEEEAGPNG